MLLTLLFAGVKLRTEKEELFSAPYETLQKIQENKYIGKLTLKTELGIFEFCDDITVDKGDVSVYINCTFKSLAECVKGVGLYCGVNLSEKYENLQFFAPSAWYGNDDLFEGKSNKIPFIDNVAGGSIDCIGAPVCGAFNYLNGNAHSIEILNAKYDTVINADSDLMIDERITLSGLGVRIQKQVKLFCTFPATYYHVAGSKRTVEWYLPASKEKTVSLQYRVKDYTAENYHSFMKKTWREAYGKYAEINEGINSFVVRKALLDYVSNSFNVIANVPQYMTNTDHFANESGFLYRNADLAYLMLRYGYEIKDKEIIQRAKQVLDVQVNFGFLGEKQVFPFERSRAEGVIALLHAYKFLKQKGENHNFWFEYVKKEAERFEDVNEYYSIPLLCELGKTEIAKQKSEKIWNEFSKMHFFGGIVDFVGQIVVDRESGYLGLYAFLSVYEATQNEKWLERARFCADYLETYQNLRKNGFYLYGTTGNEHYNMASIGNESLRLNGLSFISANCCAGDIINVLAAPLYYKLYKYSDDAHYYDYACLLERNSLEYVDLYNKAGSLTDVLLSSGLGYTSEYFQLAISNDPVCLYTGCAHDANIAWVPYVILNAQQEIYDLTGDYFLQPVEACEIKMNIAPECVFECNGRDTEKLAAFDFYKRTLFLSGDYLKIKLNSEAGSIVFAHSYSYKTNKYKLTFFGEQGIVIKEEKIEREARFVSVKIPSGCLEIGVKFIENADLRQIQIFGKNKIDKAFVYKEMQERYKQDKDYYTSGTSYNADRNKSFPFDYLYKENSTYYKLYYDNVKNAYCCKKEPYLQIKTANLVHPGKELPAVRSFTVTADGIYDILCEISASSYLKKFGGSVILRVYENEALLAEKTYLIQRKRGEAISLKRKLKKKDVLYFEIWALEENNRNCLVTNEIIIRKELK